MRKYTQLDGYNAAVGYRISQDEKSYILIGTDNGALRFDGKYFKELNTVNGSSNEILECIPFTHNSIGILPLIGQFYFLDHDTLIKPHIYIEASRLLNCYLHDIWTGSGWLWDVGIYNSYYKLSPSSLQRISHFPKVFHPYFAYHNYLLGIDTLTKNYFYYNYELNSLNPIYYTNHKPVHIDSTSFIPIHRTYGTILINNVDSKNIDVFNWNPSDSLLQKINTIKILSSNFPFTSYSYQKRQYLFTNKSDTIYYCPDVTDKRASEKILTLNIAGVAPNNCFIDNHNNLWMTSINNALYFLSEAHVKNALIVQNFDLKNNIPKSVFKIKSEIFLAYANSNELNIFTPKGKEHFSLNNSFGSGVRNIKILSDSILLLYDKDIALFNIKNKTIEYFNMLGPSYKQVCPYGSDFLAATNAEVMLVYKNKDKNYESKIIFNYRAVTVNVLSDSILIGTPSGLFVKSDVNGEPHKITDSIINNADISDISALDNNNALIATNGRGLLLYNINSKVNSIKKKNLSLELPSRIKELYKSDKYTYWASTNAGAYRICFTPEWQVYSVQNYTFYDGLPSNNVSSIYVLNDTVYIATAEGLGILDLKSDSTMRMPVPDLYINSIQSGKIHFREPEKRINLLYHQNEIRLSLSAISYESLGNISYFYKLWPYQNEWIKTQDPEVMFSHLPPGNFVFEVYATNAQGGKSKITRLQIVIKPAFWQTVAFKVLIVSIFIAIVLYFIFFQIKKAEKKRNKDIQQKKHLAELELEAIKAQINPHFIYNCLNSIQYLNYKEDYEQAQEYLSIFSRLIRKTMQYAQRVFISVDEEVEYLSNYLQMEQLRFKDKLRYKITVDPLIQKDAVLPAMLLQPYVENALKHGIAQMTDGGIIEVFFNNNISGLEIEIRDNGPGFSDRKTQDSLGLRLSGTRALSYNELFNVKISVSWYNEQDVAPQKRGAVVKITIIQAKNGSENN